MEVDLSYPPGLHDDQRDFPLAPTKDIVEEEWLGEYQLNLNEQHNLPSSKVKNLLQTFLDKERYVVLYNLLQLYIELGLVIKKVHRVLQFLQESWLSPYITLNSEKRQVAANNFEENFHKLMNNAVYGKNCESKRRRSKITITRNAEQVLNVVSKFEFDRYTIFVENMIALTTRQNLSFGTLRLLWEPLS